MHPERVVEVEDGEARAPVGLVGLAAREDAPDHAQQSRRRERDRDPAQEPGDFRPSQEPDAAEGLPPTTVSRYVSGLIRASLASTPVSTSLKPHRELQIAACCWTLRKASCTSESESAVPSTCACLKVFGYIYFFLIERCFSSENLPGDAAACVSNLDAETLELGGFRSWLGFEVDAVDEESLHRVDQLRSATQLTGIDWLFRSLLRTNGLRFKSPIRVRYLESSKRARRQVYVGSSRTRSIVPSPGHQSQPAPAHRT